MTNVALDAATDGGPFTSASSRTFAHTVGASLTNGILYVNVDFYTNGAVVTIGATGVTYNGVTMTRVAQSARSPDDDRSEIWRLAAPAAGTHNVVITFSGGATDGEAGAMSFQFVDQTTPERASSVTTAVSSGLSSTTATISVPNAQSGDAAIDACTWDLAATTGTMVTHSPRTQRYNTGGAGNEGGAGSSMLGPANPQTLDWTFSTGRAWSMAGLIIANDGGGGGGPTPVSASDAGTLGEGPIGIGLNAAEAGTLGEATANALGTADSATLSESFKNALAGQDAASMAETVSIAVAVVAQQSAAFAEQVAIALAANDTASLSQLATVAIPVAANQGATMADVATVVANVAATQSATLGESISVDTGVTSVTRADTGHVSESATIFVVPAPPSLFIVESVPRVGVAFANELPIQALTIVGEVQYSGVTFDSMGTFDGAGTFDDISEPVAAIRVGTARVT